MRRTVIALALLLAAELTGPGLASAQTQITMNGSSHGCGKVSSPLNCYGIPVEVQIGGQPSAPGTIWLDIYSNNTGFILFTTAPFSTTAKVTGVNRVFNDTGRLTSITIAFAGSADPETVREPFTGSATFNFSYHYSSGGGGRGGAGSGWFLTETGGTVAIARN